VYRKGPKPQPPKGCLWIEQAAVHVGLELTTLRKWRLLGKGPVGFKVGGYVAYKVADLDAYLDSQYQAAITPDPNRKHESRPAEPCLSQRVAA
jgi:hypothetical protein